MINSLDNNVETTTTSNGNAAYKWSNVTTNPEESICQLYFQTVLNTSGNNDEIINKFENMVYNNLYNDYYKYLLKFVLQTRDIHEGKGLCDLTYGFLGVLTKLLKTNPEAMDKQLYYRLIGCIVNDFKTLDTHSYKHQKAYGSWKDIKYFLTYLKENKLVNNDFIDQFVEDIYVPQMIEDNIKYSMGQPITLCGKWLPRETSKKFGWLAKRIAFKYYEKVYGNILPQPISTIMKAYRLLVTSLNKYLDTTQIHMTRREWDKINFDNVTAQTIHKSKNSFMNSKNINEEHRRVCKDNFVDYIQKCANNEKQIKSGTLMPHYLVKDIIFNQEMEETEKTLLNLQWNKMIEKLTKNKYNFMKDCIACIDVSPSMYNQSCQPLLSSIGMGLACIEVSNIKRAFTFSLDPTWINIPKEMPFVEKVNMLKQASWGGSTNIYKMFKMIAEISSKNKVSDEEIEKHTLIIFSDMQFDECVGPNRQESLMKSIKNLFMTYGYKTVPYLIFWNLRQTSNFPVIKSTKNCLMLSGNNTILLKFFMNTELSEIKKMSNWTLLKQLLDNDRYDIF